MNESKLEYVSPQLEVIEMENEGVIAASSPSIGEGTHLQSASPAATSYSNQASGSDLEDMINNIFTIEQ